MNLITFVLIAIIIISLSVMVLYHLNLFMTNYNDKLDNLIKSFMYILFTILIVYTIFEYLGKVDSIIKQGVFRSPVLEESTHNIVNEPPILNTKKTDKDRYEELVKKYKN